MRDVLSVNRTRTHADRSQGQKSAVIRLQRNWINRLIRARWPVSRVLSRALAARGWPFLWDARRRTPRATYPRIWRGKAPGPVARSHSPIWSCSRWGLPCRRRYRNRGALLPHRFTLAAASRDRGGLISVALSLRSLSPGVTRHRLSVEPGLSSTTAASRSGSGHPAIWHVC